MVFVTGLKVEREAPGRPVGRTQMSKSQQKITLSASRDIPFDKLVLSQANVRRVKAGVSIEELAEDIARRTLLASLTVRPVLDESGAETGMFEIPAGGRRYRALELLVSSIEALDRVRGTDGAAAEGRRDKSRGTAARHDVVGIGSFARRAEAGSAAQRRKALDCRKFCRAALHSDGATP